MKFIADLHIHSRYSRATARNLTLPQLDFWAAKKGLSVVGTGDATHPAWLAEIREQLEPAEEGLFRLKPEFIIKAGRTRFVLSCEISSIYKKNDRVRKVHSLILWPDLESAEKFAGRLEAIGNIRSDGRPILGLDVKTLFEICLDVSPEVFFIPAHIWTPWFSLLGSKSGFDSVEECFEDLSVEIRALETGLSSDPPMNWRLSALDRYVLVSNSDAHSPDKLGREANLFEVDLSYPAMVEAMSGRGGFGGTVEFFPEEGKYHLDGHRKCGSRLDPEETRSLDGLCPVCGRPVTVGVFNRVLELADRPEGGRPAGAGEFFSLIPLTEILSEIVGVGPKSKKVMGLYEDLLTELGSELQILLDASLQDAGAAGGPLLAEALKRMRSGQVRAEGGYDGEYGRISLFEPGETDRLSGQADLFPVSVVPAKKRKKPGKRLKKKKAEQPAAPMVLVHDDPLLDDLNPEQRQAAAFGAGPLAVTAGPGTGKTLTLIRRLAWLIREGAAEPEECLGVTFTRQAAGEMAARLAARAPFQPKIKDIPIMTFHGLGLRILSEEMAEPPRVLSEEERLQAVKKAASGTRFRPAALLNLISLQKQNLIEPDQALDEDFARAWALYEGALSEMEALDFDDLVGRAVKILEREPVLADRWRRACRWLLIDEYQDVNLAQYRLTRLLAPDDRPNLTVIGDPDQAIYGFRGADSTYFKRFQADYPQATLVSLSQNYRSSETILKAAGQVIDHNPAPNRPRLVSNQKGPPKITTAVLNSPAAEAEYVIATIEKLLGGTSLFSFDSGRADSDREGALSLGDVAVLYRLHDLARPLAEALDRAGLPFQQAGQEPQRETDGLDFEAEKINLLTMHAAKGLEFEVVFIVGLEEDLVPYRPPNRDPADLEEERRLFFVALTRAKRRLFLTRARNRVLFGRRGLDEPSPFWSEIEEKLKIKDRLPEKKNKPKAIQLNLFN